MMKDKNSMSMSFQAIRRLLSICTSTLVFQISFLLLALTGFVYTHKIQAEEECLSSNVLCYECDSRYDPNCADPFDFSAAATLEPQIKAQHAPRLGDNETQLSTGDQRQATQTEVVTAPNELVVNSTIPTVRQPKKLPAVNVCHGCCVKITSKTPDGVTYVKRTCTTNLQINFFMVGLVCMKESGDRGKMCFCENDYCNGQLSNHLPESRLMTLLIAVSIIRLLLPYYHIPLTHKNRQ